MHTHARTPPFTLPAHAPSQVLTEAYNWIRGAVVDFLLPAFRVPALLCWAKEGLGSANAATRTAAVQLLGCMHAFLGGGLADMVSARVVGVVLCGGGWGGGLAIAAQSPH
jgi:hypothetical protein